MYIVFNISINYIKEVIHMTKEMNENNIINYLIKKSQPDERASKESGATNLLFHA